MSEEYKRKNVRLLIAVGIVGVAVVLMALAGSLFGDTATETGLAPPGGGLFAGAVVPSDEDGGVVSRGGVTVTTIDDGYQDYRIDISDLEITRKAEMPEEQGRGIQFEITYQTDAENHLLDGILFEAPSIENLKENRNKWPTKKFGIIDEKVWDKKTGETLYYKYHTTFSGKTGTPMYIWIIHQGSGDFSSVRQTSYIYRIDI